MSTNFENLKEYFKNTPKEQIQKDWDETQPFDKVGPTIVEFFNNQKRYKLEAYSNNVLRNLLNDVVNVLDLSDDMMEKHGPIGTAPAELVRLVLEQKDTEIRALKAGMKAIEPNTSATEDTEQYPSANKPDEDDVHEFIEQLCHWNHHDDKDRKGLRELERKFGIQYIDATIEKHNELQYTYYFEVDYNTKENLFLEIENGIQNGTQINSESWGSIGTKPETRTVEVLKDVIFSEEKFKNWCFEKHVNYEDVQFLHRKANNIFQNKKEFILEIYRKQNYDNYVTGGGTHVTDKAYNDWFKEFNDKGCFWECVYEEIEADPNFV